MDDNGASGGSPSMWVSDSIVGTVDDDAVWSGAPKNPQIKIEGEEVTKIDTLAQRRKAQEEAAGASATDQMDVDDQPPGPKAPQKPLTYAERRDQQTLEELVERTSEERDGRVCVFYIPKPLPPLDTVKDDDDDGHVKEEADDDVTMLDGAGEGTTVDLTNEEQEEGDDDAGGPAATGRRRPAPPLNIGEGGFLGKMVVRKSGKAEMDWGGFPYKVVMYISRHNLLEAVALETADTKKKVGDVAYDGTAMALGEVHREFKFAPVLFTKKTRKPFGAA